MAIRVLLIQLSSCKCTILMRPELLTDTLRNGGSKTAFHVPIIMLYILVVWPSGIILKNAKQIFVMTMMKRSFYCSNNSYNLMRV